jgi:hypothetical protein
LVLSNDGLLTRHVGDRKRTTDRRLQPPDPSKDSLMRYTLLLHYPEATAADIGREAIEAGMAAFQAYARALDDAGVLESAEVLQPVGEAPKR